MRWPFFAKRSKQHDQSHGIVMAWPVGTERPDPPTPRTLPLPNLTHLTRLDAADWLRSSMTTFGMNVASFLPARFPAYLRIYHPFESWQGNTPWKHQRRFESLDLTDPALAEDFACNGGDEGQARSGSTPRPMIETLIEYLRTATTTPEDCYYALWEGYGGSVVPFDSAPKLVLPGRAYHLFAGSATAATSGYGIYDFHYQSANLWWPDDRAWFVATDVDFAWTYVGGSRVLVDALLADPRLESVETLATARW